MTSKVHVSAATGIAGIALVLQVVGFALPEWFVINIGESFISIGLWNVEYCAQKLCTSITMERVLAVSQSKSTFASLEWREYQAEATLSFIGAVLSVAFLTAQTVMICVVKGNTWTKTNVLAYLGACTSIGSALLGFIVVGRIAIVILQVDVNEYLFLSAPNALIIFGIGNFFFLCVFVMELNLPRMLRRETQPPPYNNFQNELI